MSKNKLENKPLFSDDTLLSAIFVPFTMSCTQTSGMLGNKLVDSAETNKAKTQSIYR
jgi:hypothetical protein